METETKQEVIKKVKVELLEELSQFDLFSLCEAAACTIGETKGFSIGSNIWIEPMHNYLAEYYEGVMLIPERKLIVGRTGLDILGSLQLILPRKSNKVSGFAVIIQDLFVVEGARKLGMAKAMFKFAEDYAREAGYETVRLNVSSDMSEAVSLVEKLGYKRWGVLEKHESRGELNRLGLAKHELPELEMVSGYYYSKDL